MGVTEMLARSAVRRAHVLVVQTPGHWLTRVAVERHVLARSWLLATSPADADVLVVCGTPGPELTQLMTRLWDQMPGPRTRIQVDAPEHVVAALRTAEDELLDSAWQRTDSQDRPDARSREPKANATSPGTHAAVEAPRHGDADPHAHHRSADPASPAARDRHHDDQNSGMHHEQAGHDGMIARDHVHQGGTNPTSHGGHEHGRLDHGEQAGNGHMDHEGMAHGGMTHEGMGHGAMEMAPAGIPLARGGEDRDGLELDVLHLQLGPVLPYWPAGLILTCTMQGDVILDAEARMIDADTSPAARDPRRMDQLRQAARRCDNATNLLALAGWMGAASRARRIRDALLSDPDVDRAAADLDRLRRSVRRSWLLRWSLRRLRHLTDQDLARHGLPAHLRGDTRGRMLSMLHRAARSLAATTGEPGIAESSPMPVGGIADVVRGLDLAAARLVVASLDLDALSANGEVRCV